jgi:muramidase (phage lysozyme)
MAAITAEQAGNEELVKFLDLIAFSEGTAGKMADGYGVIVSGIDGPATFTDYTDHPFANGRLPVVVRTKPSILRSTASGRYQLLYRYWRVYKAQLNLPDFSPLSQDKVALQQVRECRATTHIVNRNLGTAIMLCRNIWASLPGNSYGQGGKTLAELLEHYDSLEV